MLPHNLVGASLLPGGSDCKASAYNAGDQGSIPASGSSLEKATHSCTLVWKIPWRSMVASFIKRLFSSSSLSAINVVSSAFLRLLIFLLAILIPPCVSSIPPLCTLHMLNKQGDNIQPWCTPFPLWNQSVVPCPVLTVASWPAYRFLKRQVRWSGTGKCKSTPNKIPLCTQWDGYNLLKRKNNKYW